jgi:hypothetical protein
MNDVKIEEIVDLETVKGGRAESTVEDYDQE